MILKFNYFSYSNFIFFSQSFPMIPIIIAVVVVGGVAVTVGATATTIVLKGKIKKFLQKRRDKKNKLKPVVPVISLYEEEVPLFAETPGVDIPNQNKDGVIIPAVDDLTKQELEEDEEEEQNEQQQEEEDNDGEEEEEEEEVHIPISMPIEEQEDVFEKFVEGLDGEMDEDSKELARLLLESTNCRVNYIATVDRMTTKMVEYAKKTEENEKPEKKRPSKVFIFNLFKENPQMKCHTFPTKLKRNVNQEIF